MDGVLKLLFKEFINQKAARKAYTMKLKTVPETTTSIVTVPMVTTPKLLWQTYCSQVISSNYLQLFSQCVISYKDLILCIFFEGIQN